MLFLTSTRRKKAHLSKVGPAWLTEFFELLMLRSEAEAELVPLAPPPLGSEVAAEPAPLEPRPSSWEAEAELVPWEPQTPGSEVAAGLVPLEPRPSSWEAEAELVPSEPRPPSSEVVAEPDPLELRWQSTQIRGAMQRSRISRFEAYANSLRLSPGDGHSRL
jgi:hypothetical protein